MLYKFKGHAPQAMHQPWNGWVAENATVIGQVELGQQVSIWFGAVVRADNCKIRLGDFTNIQENAVLHTDAGIEMNIGNYVTIGHQAMLHGCTVGDNSLIGINAVVYLKKMKFLGQNWLSLVSNIPYVTILPTVKVINLIFISKP